MNDESNISTVTHTCQWTTTLLMLVDVLEVLHVTKNKTKQKSFQRIFKLIILHPNQTE